MSPSKKNSFFLFIKINRCLFSVIMRDEPECVKKVLSTKLQNARLTLVMSTRDVRCLWNSVNSISVHTSLRILPQIKVLCLTDETPSRADSFFCI